MIPISAGLEAQTIARTRFLVSDGMNRMGTTHYFGHVEIFSLVGYEL